MNWDQRFMDLARHVAGWSKDPSTQVGAVLVGRDKREICFGYNGFPPGIRDTPERLADRETKYKLIQHAERNALDNCRFDPKGGLLYVTHCPCTECAKSIISKGISEVVRLAQPEFDLRWQPHLEWVRFMLDEAGVQLRVL